MTSTAYFLGDALGSVRQLTAARGGGRLALARWYDPYGTLVSSRGDAATVYGFTGEWGTTLLDLRARWYAPAYGRFFVRDSWPGAVQMPGTLHPYLYSFNNPINYTDPSGLDPWWCEGRPDKTQCYQAYYQRYGSPSNTQYLNPLATNVLVGLARLHESNRQLSQYTRDFVSGAAYQFLDDVSLGLTSATDPYSASRRDEFFILGRIAGRGASLGLGTIETLGGGGCAALGLATSASGVGILVAVSGTGIAIHGGAVVYRGLTNPLPNIYYASSEGEGSSTVEQYRQRLDNQKEQLTDETLDAARRELNGEVVAIKPGGDPYDHVQKVRQAQRGLRNLIQDIQGRFSDVTPGRAPTDLERQELRSVLAEASRLLDHSEQFVP